MQKDYQKPHKKNNNRHQYKQLMTDLNKSKQITMNQYLMKNKIKIMLMLRNKQVYIYVNKINIKNQLQ